MPDSWVTYKDVGTALQASQEVFKRVFGDSRQEIAHKKWSKCPIDIPELFPENPKIAHEASKDRQTGRQTETETKKGRHIPPPPLVHDFFLLGPL